MPTLPWTGKDQAVIAARGVPFCLLADGRVLVVEYKGAHLKDNLDEQEKRRIGQLWERLSAGKALFLWAVNRDDRGRDVFTQLRETIKR